MSDHEEFQRRWIECKNNANGWRDLQYEAEKNLLGLYPILKEKGTHHLSLLKVVTQSKRTFDQVEVATFLEKFPEQEGILFRVEYVQINKRRTDEAVAKNGDLGGLLELTFEDKLMKPGFSER
jgi:hypothetical protein